LVDNLSDMHRIIYLNTKIDAIAAKAADEIPKIVYTNLNFQQ